MDRDRLARAFLAFSDVVARLRKDCPWDRKQTHESLRRYLLEETHEVLDALDGGDLDELRGELGDLLFQIWFHAEIASEGQAEAGAGTGGGAFDLAQVLEGITDKLVRRHPHVFGEVRADDAAAVKRNWERIKLAEGRTSVLQGLPPGLPALAASLVLQEKAAAVGFDWSEPREVAAKVREELGELFSEVTEGRSREDVAGTPAAQRIRHELGDLLFALVNYGRHLGVNAEDALREANRRFTWRFQHIEEAVRRSGRAITELTLAELDELWKAAKRAEAQGGRGGARGHG